MPCLNYIELCFIVIFVRHSQTEPIQRDTCSLHTYLVNELGNDDVTAQQELLNLMSIMSTIFYEIEKKMMSNCYPNSFLTNIPF